jgi:membrane protein YdbS with pleckstrin-like domain
MELVLRFLKPLFVPLLRLDPRPPHLPEGSSLVRELKPSHAWLSFRYLRVLFGLLNQVIGVGVLAFLAISQVKTWGLVIALGLALVEIVVVGFSLVVTRVDWELRHYLVGDRSLRVSVGALTRKEVTISYANVQNLEVSQGPIERLFGFKTLTLSTAGAGSPSEKGENLHIVELPGLENAEAIRSLMLGMLKHEKDVGLGEPDTQAATAGFSVTRLGEVRDAARALRAAAEQAR